MSLSGVMKSRKDSEQEGVKRFSFSYSEPSSTPILKKLRSTFAEAERLCLSKAKSLQGRGGASESPSEKAGASSPTSTAGHQLSGPDPLASPALLALPHLFPRNLVSR